MEQSAVLQHSQWSENNFNISVGLYQVIPLQNGATVKRYRTRLPGFEMNGYEIVVCFKLKPSTEVFPFHFSTSRSLPAFISDPYESLLSIDTKIILIQKKGEKMW